MNLRRQSIIALCVFCVAVAAALLIGALLGTAPANSANNEPITPVRQITQPVNIWDHNDQDAFNQVFIIRVMHNCYVEVEADRGGGLSPIPCPNSSGK